MQDTIEKPSREFFKPAVYQGGSNGSHYRGSPNSNFFKALTNGIQNGQKSFFMNNDDIEKTSYDNIARRHSPNYNQFSQPGNRTPSNNSSEGAEPHYFQSKGQLVHNPYNQPQDLQLATERYAAYGARPLGSPYPSADKNGSFLKNDAIRKERQESDINRSHRDSRKLFNLLWVLILIFIVLGGISLGLGLYYGLEDRAGTFTGTPQPPNDTASFVSTTTKLLTLTTVTHEPPNSLTQSTATTKTDAIPSTTRSTQTPTSVITTATSSSGTTRASTTPVTQKSSMEESSISVTVRHSSAVSTTSA